MLAKILNSGGEGEAQLPKILGSVSPGNHSQSLWWFIYLNKPISSKYNFMLAKKAQITLIYLIM